VHSQDKKHDHMTNIAFGGPDYKTIYITEALSGDVLMARLPIAGKKLFGLQ
jgi:gluconolactonase